MKKLMFILSVIAVGLLFAGCASTEVVQGANLTNQPVSNTGTTVAHLDSQNWGIYLFSIPLLTGSTQEPGAIDILSDTVNVENVVPMMASKAKSLGATKLLDMSSQFSDFGFIFYSRNINVSANAVR